MTDPDSFATGADYPRVPLACTAVVRIAGPCQNPMIDSLDPAPNHMSAERLVSAVHSVKPCRSYVSAICAAMTHTMSHPGSGNPTLSHPGADTLRVGHPGSESHAPVIMPVRCLFSSWFRKLRQVRQKGRASLPHIEAAQMAKFASTEMTSLY